MANHTHTASTIHADPKQNHTGVNFTYGDISLNTTTSSFVGYMVKVPHGAKIVDWWFYGSTALGDAQLASIGWSRPQNEGSGTVTHSLNSTALQAAAVNMNPTATASIRGQLVDGILPLTISLSDDVDQRYAWLHVHYNNTASGSFISRLGVYYVMDENSTF